MTQAPIRVLLAEDQSLVRGALVALLSMEDDIEVVAQVSTGDAVVPTALELRPDVAMLVRIEHAHGCKRMIHDRDTGQALDHV